MIPRLQQIRATTMVEPCLEPSLYLHMNSVLSANLTFHPCRQKLLAKAV